MLKWLPGEPPSSYLIKAKLHEGEGLPNVAWDLPRSGPEVPRISSDLFLSLPELWQPFAFASIRVSSCMCWFNFSVASLVVYARCGQRCPEKS